MKKSPLTPALIGVLLVFAIAALVLTWFNIQATRKGRQLQAVAAQINGTRMVMDALAKEAIAYSQTNRAIDPILISLNLKPGQPAPAAKPTTR